MDAIASLIREMRMEVQKTGDRILTYRGTTENVASDGGILRAAGMEAEDFDRNPVVLWRHGHVSEQPIIGRVKSRRLDTKERAWDFAIEFPPEGTDDQADRIFRLAEAGFVRAASVSFDILEEERVTDQDRVALGLGPWGWVASRWRLRELSLVPIGADPFALKRAREAGSISEKDFEAISIRSRSRDPKATATVKIDTDGMEHLAGAIRASNAELRDTITGLTAQIAGLREELRDADLEEEAGDDKNNRPEPARGEEPTTARSKPYEVEDRSVEQKLDEILRSLKSKEDSA